MPRNFRKIPKRIRAKLNTLPDEVVAACLIEVSAEALANGDFEHLGIALTEDGLELPPPEGILPPAETWKTSERNVNGWEIVRNDLPKETHYNYIDSPNWGDDTNGTHEVALPYERYPRDLMPPILATIIVEAGEPVPEQDKYLLRFRVSEVIDKNNDGFEDTLLFCINLLQENVGNADIEASSTTFAEHIALLGVAWDILPPGTVNEALARVFKGGAPSQTAVARVTDRYSFMMDLGPEKLVFGSSGFQRYFGALLRDDLVLFENVEYGNAIYLMFEDWEELSKLSRRELMSGRDGDGFVRITHTDGWKARVKKLLANVYDYSV